MELKETVLLMKSVDYKSRLKAEYLQTKIRYEKLKALNNKIEAANYVLQSPCCVGEKEPKIAMPEHDCPDYLLREQQRIMGEYLHILEVRAIIEDINLANLWLQPTSESEGQETIVSEK